MIAKIILISTVAGLKTEERSGQDVQLKRNLIKDARRDDWARALVENVGSADSLTPKKRHLFFGSIRDFMRQAISSIEHIPENLYSAITGKMLRPLGLRNGLRVVSVVVVPLTVVGTTALGVYGIYNSIQSGSSSDSSSNGEEQKSEDLSRQTMENKDIIDFTRLHNCYREKVSANPLTWNTELANFAQEKAELRANTNQETLDHDMNDGWEENYSTNHSIEKAVTHWWSEIFPFDKKKDGSGAEDFFHMISKSTKEFGCGSSPKSQESTVYVCLYKKSGNSDTVEQFKADVQRPSDNKKCS